ncbi:MAG: hypothetical protein JNL70_15035 [Saprospiraceae bacterium]|nr:hypothetical protein [Saprospiraceae bacterium]
MKRLFQVFSLFAMVLAVACTKTSDVDIDTASTLDVITTSDELLTLGQGTSGTVAGPMGGDTSRRHCDSVGRGRHGRHPNGGRGDSIGFADLPAAAQQYLNDSTNVSTITRIEKITLADGTVRYGVRFSDRTHIHFDANGVVIADEPRGNRFVEITLAELPAAAQTYLTTNGHTTDIAQVVKATKPDGTVIYGVRLTNNTMITFNAAGEVIPNPTRRRGRH